MARFSYRITPAPVYIDECADKRTIEPMDQMLESRVGKVCIILYALFSIVTYLSIFWCGTDACELYIVVPVMPWVYIFASDLGFSLPWAIYPVFMLLNTSVAYVVGAGIEWLYVHTVAKRLDVSK